MAIIAASNAGKVSVDGHNAAAQSKAPMHSNKGNAWRLLKRLTSRAQVTGSRLQRTFGGEICPLRLYLQHRRLS